VAKPGRPAKRPPDLRVKRVYDPPDDGDGLRVLVDRLWPRGLTKDRARVDHWPKAVSPSDGLRKRVHSGDTDWAGFVAAYRAELAEPPAAPAADDLLELTRAAKGPVTLLYASREEARSNATVLRDWLIERLKQMK